MAPAGGSQAEAGQPRRPPKKEKEKMVGKEEGKEKDGTCQFKQGQGEHECGTHQPWNPDGLPQAPPLQTQLAKEPLGQKVPVLFEELLLCRALSR